MPDDKKSFNNGDDGLFNKGDVGQEHYEKTFNRKHGSAANQLKDAESGAADSAAPDNSGTKDAQRANEASSTNLAEGFKNNVTGQSSSGKNAAGAAKSVAKGDIKGALKKGGPVGAILAFIVMMGGFLLGAQSTMPISLISQFQSNFDSQGIINRIRTKNLTKIQLDDGNTKNCVKANIFGSKKFKISSRQKAKLEASGIEVTTQGSRTVLRYQDADGNYKIVTADNFKSTYDTDTRFHNMYYEGSRTWRGSVSDWFNSLSKKFFTWIDIGRNSFRNFRKTSETDANMERMRSTISDGVETDSMKGRVRKLEGGEENDDGEYIKSRGEQDVDLSRSDVDVDADGKIRNADGIAEKITNIGARDGKGSSLVTAAVSGVCAVANLVGTIGLIATAYQSRQILLVASKIFEGIQKGQVDVSEESPNNEIGNSLTMKHYNAQYETEKSAMEANAITAIYGNFAVDINDPSVSSFNVLKNLLAGAGAAVGVSIASFKGCSYAKLAAAAAGVTLDIISLITCIVGGIFTAGVSCLVQKAVEGGASFAVSAGIAFILSTVAGLIAEPIAMLFVRDFATKVMGEDLGNVVVSGANMYMGSNHQYSGGSVASEETLTQFLAEREVLLAEDAAYERSHLSPFDTSSQNTFMGSIMTSLIPISSKLGSVTGVLSSTTSVFSNAISSLMPGASAVSAATTAQTAAAQTSENCVFLDSVGAVGDAFCNPYIISDVRTTSEDDYHPADVVNKINDDYHGFENPGEEEEVPTIDGTSNLAKYIIFCGQRESPFGMADQNIAGQVAIGDLDLGSSLASNAVNSAIGAVPIVGDLADMASEANTIANMGWVTGQACVTGNTDSGIEDGLAPTWEETKYYQRFVEDQQTAEDMGLIEQSAVTAFIDRYYEANPLDNSYEGILARRSGLTKETVIATLDQLEELVFLANYDPSDFYPLIRNNKFDKEIEISKNLNVEIDGGNTSSNEFLKTIFYQVDDRRTRNFAI